MIPSVVEIASPGLYLSKTRGFLSVKDQNGSVSKVALDDIGVLVLTSPQATLSTALMNTLAERGIITVLCDTSARPASYLYPYKTHEESTGRIQDQIAATKPANKRLWQAVVKAKIWHQAKVLEILGKDDVKRLKKLAEEVSSGDKENREAQAARVYWSALFGNDFRREPRGTGLNRLLDYGYGVLRSAVLRAIAGSGLNPSLGLSHSSRRNPFCLADDLLEPYRPVVDLAVHQLKSHQKEELNPPVKRFIAGITALPMDVPEGKSALARSMNILAQSLARSYARKTTEMIIPGISDTIQTKVITLWNETDFS